MNKPNFFVVGAPKCGTTSLMHWLSTHPEVFIPKVKEPHYYNFDHRHRNIPDRDAYFGLFQNATPRQTAIGEASVYYLYSDVAVREIEQHHPGAKYIVMIRNPVQLVVSLHEQKLFSGNENIESFEEAWHLSAKRSAENTSTVFCREPKLLNYQSMGMLGHHLERLLTSVDPDRVLVLSTDDLKASANAAYNRVLDFLEVSPEPDRTDFPTLNSAKKRRSKLVRKIIKLGLFARDKLNIPIRGTGMLDKVDSANRKETPRAPIDPALAQSIREFYAEDVKLLENLTGRDLSHWK